VTAARLRHLLRNSSRAINGPIAYILLYAALYAAFGAASPFWPKFFETRALTPQQIGLILAATMLIRLAAGPVAGVLAVLTGSLRLMLATCAIAAAGAAIALLWTQAFPLLLLVSVVQAAALAPTTSIADALSVNVAKLRMGGRVGEISATGTKVPPHHWILNNGGTS